MKTHAFFSFARRAILSVFIVFALSGCGIRVGQPPAPVPTLSESDQVRQAAAVALEHVILLSKASPLTEVLNTYQEDLGGVWVPPARDDNPEPISPALQNIPPDLNSALTAASMVFLDAGTFAPESDRAGYISVWLTLQLASTPELDTPGVDISSIGEVSATVMEHSPELVEIYDAIGYHLEILAARNQGKPSKDSAQKAAAARLIAETLVGARSGTDQDPRLGAYRGDIEALEETIEGYYAQAVSGWLKTLPHTASAHIPLVADAAWDSYVNSAPQLTPWPGLTR